LKPDINTDENAKTFGPLPEGGIDIVEKEAKSMVNTLVLGPGMYRTFAYLPILKSIKEKNIPIHIIGGYGLASIIATYYAFGYEPDLIEWKLYTNLIRSSKPYPFTNDWKDTLIKILEKDFGGKRIEESKLSLFIPEKVGNKFEYATRGRILPRLKLNIEMNMPNGLSSLMARDICELKNGPRTIQASRIVCLNVLDLNLKWKNANDYIMGVFNRSSSLLAQSMRKNQIDINLKGIELDNLSIQPDILSRSKEQSDAIIEKVQLTVGEK
jgi:hypothetical protein